MRYHRNLVAAGVPAKWVAGYHPRHLHRFSAADCDMKPLTVPVSFGVVIFLP